MMMALAEHLPLPPEILLMTRRKKYSGVADVYNPDTDKTEKVELLPNRVAAYRKYALSKQPSKTERWSHLEFQKWVSDMGYPRITEDDPGVWFPFDPKPIAEDLGIKTNRVYVYWRGYDKKPDVVCDLPATTTLLCKAALKLKKLGKWPL